MMFFQSLENVVNNIFTLVDNANNSDMITQLTTLLSISLLLSARLVNSEDIKESQDIQLVLVEW